MVLIIAEAGVNHNGSIKLAKKLVDAGAAPGGKTVLRAERMNNEKNITAMELHEDRIPRLIENLKRNHFEKINVVCGDARNLKKYFGNRMFNGILLDVPCSNTGVLQRRSDARWRVNPKRIKELNKVRDDIHWTILSPYEVKSLIFENTTQLPIELPSYPNAMRTHFNHKQLIKTIDWKNKDYDLIYSHLPEHTLQLSNMFVNETNINPKIIG